MFEKRLINVLLIALLVPFWVQICNAQEVRADEPNEAAREISESLRQRLEDNQQPERQVSTTRLFWQMVISLALLLALAVIGVYVSKRFVPKLGASSSKQMRIIETLHLGSRRAIHLIQAGERTLIIGVTNEQITRLADLNDFSAVLADQNQKAEQKPNEP